VRLGVFNNRQAGSGGTHSGEDARRVLERLRERRDIPHVETDESGIRDGLTELAREEVDVLAVNGGDGTLQRVLTELLANNSQFARLPLIAPLRSGRTNMNARNIGSQRDPVRALETLAGALGNGGIEHRIDERPVLRIDLGDGAPAQYGLFIGFGTIHRAIALTHRMFPPGRAQGVFGSGIVTAILLGRLLRGSEQDVLAPDVMDIRIDGREVAAHSFTLVIATTLDRLFLGLRPFWGSENAPIHFTSVAKGAFGVGPAFNIARGRKPRHAVDGDGTYVSHNINSAELVVDCGLTIDGEMYAPQSGRTVRLAADDRIRFVRTD
jgi:hypothetical protein